MYIWTICEYVGALALLQFAVTIIKGVVAYMIRPHAQVFSKYGKTGSWVVVTGGTDGIGLEMCHQLAEQGANVCIIARNVEKLNEKQNLIKERFPKVQTRGVVFDFAKKCQIEDYREGIYEQIKDLDIAMLFLNAGYGQIGAFSEISYADVHKQVSVNAIHPAYTIKVLLDKMLERKERSAIVITSSSSGNGAQAGTIIYSCTKSFATYLGVGLHYEVRDKIDCLSWTPVCVATKSLNRPAGGFVLTTKVAVADMLRQLGHEARTYGNHIHAILGYLLASMPSVNKLQQLAFKGIKKTHAAKVAVGRADQKDGSRLEKTEADKV